MVIRGYSSNAVTSKSKSLFLTKSFCRGYVQGEEVVIAQLLRCSKAWSLFDKRPQTYSEKSLIAIIRIYEYPAKMPILPEFQAINWLNCLHL